jgi:hypothetical protein
MDDQLKAAFASATETVKNTLTLSSAILTVSVTFVKDINKAPTNFQVWILEASWVALFIAVLACIATLMAITGTLSKENPLTSAALYSSNVKTPMTTAVLAFLIGIGLTATYGMLSV